MAKFIFVAGLMLAIVAAITALPAAELEPLEMMGEAQNFEAQEFGNLEEDHLRFRRVTCDLLSFGGVIGDSACAANCLSMGKAGGSCSGGVCQCRTTKIADLWNKRFG